MPRPARLLAAALSAATATALLAGCTGTNAVTDGSSGPQLKQLQTGSTGLLPIADRHPAPTLRGETIDRGRLDVAALKGKVVVVNFWASWCPPCRAESPYLVKVATDMKASGVEFVGVNIKDDRTAAVRFDQVHDVPYPSLFDQPGVLLTRFRTLVPQVPPSTLLIDRQGRLAGLFRGGVTEAQLSGPVQVLAKEKT
ncbi:MAG: TlpA family protein disulfide reductase [Frankiales bacterium]|nr:TlpA family protein disulfide reductase [Frankiales bacterium]